MFAANFSLNLFTRYGRREEIPPINDIRWIEFPRSEQTCFFEWVRGVKIKKYIIEIHLGHFCMVMFTCARINVRTRKKASLFYLIKCTICPKASSSSSSLIMIILDSLIEIVFIARTLSYSSAQNFSLYARLLIMRRFFLLAHKGIRVKSEWRLCKKKILLGWRTSWEKFFKRPVNRKINHRISRLSLSHSNKKQREIENKKNHILCQATCKSSCSGIINSERDNNNL